MAPIVYLVSGANRGIGLGLVKGLVTRENVVVFAGARNPSAATELQELEEQHPGKIHILKLVSSDKPGNEAAIAEIKAKVGRLDVVIANAGISQWYGPSIEAPPEELRRHFEVNVVGTHVLFQACYELLKASTPTPKFIPIASGTGSITLGAAMPMGIMPYAMSKTALHYLARKLHFEHEKDGLIVFPLNPGLVATDQVAYAVTQDDHVKTIRAKSMDETVPQLLARIDEATREGEGGQFVQFDGTRREW